MCQSWSPVLTGVQNPVVTCLHKSDHTQTYTCHAPGCHLPPLGQSVYRRKQIYTNTQHTRVNLSIYKYVRTRARKLCPDLLGSSCASLSILRHPVGTLVPGMHLLGHARPCEKPRVSMRTCTPMSLTTVRPKSALWHAGGTRASCAAYITCTP